MTDLSTESQPAALSYHAGKDRHSTGGGGGAGWLGLAATPTFVLMALLVVLGDGPPDAFCAAMKHASPLDGMVPMYLLMSLFHSGPWLTLIFGRGGSRRT